MSARSYSSPVSHFTLPKIFHTDVSEEPTSSPPKFVSMKHLRIEPTPPATPRPESVHSACSDTSETTSLAEVKREAVSDRESNNDGDDDRPHR